MEKMYQHTKNECGKCAAPHSCCDEIYCSEAKIVAKLWFGVDLKETGHKTLPYMGESGCTVQPHMRPRCTVHVCSIDRYGFKKEDEQWTNEYFKLREDIEISMDELVEEKGIPEELSDG